MSAYALPGLFPPLPCQQTACPVGRFDATQRIEQQQQQPRVRCRVQQSRIDALQLVQVLTATTTTSNNNNNATNSRNNSRRQPPPPTLETAMLFDLQIDLHHQTHHVTCSLDALRRLTTDMNHEESGYNVCVEPVPFLPEIGGTTFSHLYKSLEAVRPQLERWLQYTIQANPDSYSLKSLLLMQTTTTPWFKKSSSLESIQESDDEE